MEQARHLRKTIGSSDVSAILGLNPYATPYSVWARLVGLYNDNEEIAAKESVDWGNRLEPVIAARAQEELSIRELKETPLEKNDKVFVSDEHSFMSATPDYLVMEKNGIDRIVECKNSSWRMAHQWDDGAIPDHAHAQIMHQLRVCKVYEGSIAALIGGNKFEYREVPFDKALSDMITEQLVAFWQLVEEVVPPAVNATDGEIVQKIYPQDSGLEMIAPDRWEAVLDTIVQAKAEIKNWEQKQKQAESELKAYLKDATKAKCGRYTVTWKTQEANRFNTEMFKKEHPGLAGAYIYATQSRVLRIKEGK